MRSLVLFVLFGLLFCSSLRAANVCWTRRLEGSSIVSSGSGFGLSDPEHAQYGMNAYRDADSYCYVRLSFGELPTLTNLSGNYSATVTVTGNFYPMSGGSPIPFSTALLVSASGGLIDSDLQELRRHDVYRVELTEVSSSVSLPSDIFLELGFCAERYYTFDWNLSPTAYHYNRQFSTPSRTLCANGTDASSAEDIELVWSYVSGAEGYDLEWAWVDSYSSTLGILPASQVSMTESEFKSNSTRIRTNEQSYRIPNVFARGYLVYRVRAIGKYTSAPYSDLLGSWSFTGNGTTKVSNWSNYVRLDSGHGSTKNWKYNATYAEEGKKKEIVEYFDGSNRSRQIVTRINSMDQAVAAGSVYDHQGRASVQVLPAPMSSPALQYYGGLNRNASGTMYSYSDFDLVNQSNACNVTAGSMNQGYGAALYYSTGTPTSGSDWQQYVPESNGYPFSQVVYTPDNTGRIYKQGGVGPTHQIGSGHETTYMYAHPDQTELDRLFGYKAGYAIHYEKNVVIDPNGQASVSYLDAAGRVVATALSGASPLTVDGLESMVPSVSVSQDLLNKLNVNDHDTPLDNNQLFSTGNFGSMSDGLRVSSPLVLTAPESVTLNYSVSADIFDASCTDYSMHYPYVYKVILRVVDNCGVEHYTNTFTVGNQVLNGSGSTSPSYTTTLSLGIGSYTISKDIVIDNSAYEAYAENYISPSNICLADPSVFDQQVEVICNTTCTECLEELGSWNDYYARVLTEMGVSSLPLEEEQIKHNLYDQLVAACMTPCTPVTSCGAYRQSMISDLQPGGQYGGFDPSDNLSVFASGNSLGCNWQNLDYFDEYGNPASVLVSYDGSSFNTGVSSSVPIPSGPQTILIAPNDLTDVSYFMEHFEPSWAESFLPYHPEYYLLSFMDNICTITDEIDNVPGLLLSSEQFDYFLNTIDNFDDAQSQQVLLGGNFTVDFTASSLYDLDPFFDINYPQSVLSSSLRNSIMFEQITNYEQTGHSMLQHAIILVVHNGVNPGSVPSDWTSILNTPSYAVHKDAIWKTYTALYTGYKAKIRQLMLDWYGFSQTGWRQTMIPIFSNNTFSFQSVLVEYHKFNGAIGPNGVYPSVLNGFSGRISSNLFMQLLSQTMSIYSSQQTVLGTTMTLIPAFFQTPEYDSKQIRITRTDALYNAAVSTDAAVSDMQASADYQYWEQTGLCPATVDMTALLNGLVSREELLSTTNTSTNTPELHLDLCATISQGSSIPGSTVVTITPSVTSSSLTLQFGGWGSTASYSLSAPGAYSWTDYGSSWQIYSVSHPYPVPSSNNIQFIVHAGSGSGIQEYVVTLSSPISLNDCATEFANDPSLNPSCPKKNQFEQALMNVIQTMASSSNGSSVAFYGTGINISNLAAYSSSILTDYLGSTASWKYDGGGAITITGSVNTLHVSGFGTVNSGVSFQDLSLSGTSIDATILTTSGASNWTLSMSAEQTTNHSPVTLDFGCSCEELASDSYLEDLETGMLNLLNYLLTQSTIADGTSLPQIDAIEQYLSFNSTDVRIYSFSHPQPRILSFKLGVPGQTEECNYSFDFTSLPGDLLYLHQIEIEPDMSFVLYASYNGVNITPYTGVLRCMSIPCDNCVPDIQAPISCNETYDNFVGFMLGQFDVASSDVTVFTSNYIPTLQQYCDGGMQYIVEAYEYYLTTLSITSTSDLMYLSLTEFGNTPIGYSNSKLVTAIQAYAAYLTTNNINSSNFDEQNGWKNYILNVYLVANQVCPGASPPFVFPSSTVTPPCDQWTTLTATVDNQIQYDQYLQDQLEQFRVQYVAGAISSLVEHFDILKNDREYHYTLYYYDRAGNLIQTVPPQGVHRIEPGTGTYGTFAQIASWRSTHPQATALSNGSVDVAPAHNFLTQYRYNSLNQLVWQSTPDGEETDAGGSQSLFAYDKLGRIIVSQNEEQHSNNTFSYTLYDGLGRVYEAGVAAPTSTYLISSIGRLTDLSNNTVEIDDLLTGAVRTEVTRSFYDDLTGKQITNPSTASSMPVVSQFPNYQSNGRNRVCGIIQQDSYSTDNNFQSATYYEYDIHGNVKRLLQVNMDQHLLQSADQYIKSMTYEYDLVSGNVNRVIYQPGKTDQFIHRYNYDADNRITSVETSEKGYIFIKEAKYFYYDHGPLARTELGDKKVQAEDYAYTLQGWIKAVNGEKNNLSNLMGGDSKSTGVNKYVGGDVFGYSLSYFNNDFSCASTTASGTTPLYYSGASNSNGAQLFNGNIRSMYTLVAADNALQTHQMRYTYDQLNRLKSMTGLDPVTGNLSGYKSEYSYYANGNIEHMDNWNTSGQIDDMTYIYTGFNNELVGITDDAPLHTSHDYGASGSYTYDKIGRLKTDAESGITSITWNVQNKVKTVTKSNQIITFTYDPLGHRIGKRELNTNTNITTNYYYVLDAQGNQMAMYKHTSTAGTVVLQERMIYGSKRIGTDRVAGYHDVQAVEVLTPGATNYDRLVKGARLYELSNHLGNVMSVITDKKSLNSGTWTAQTDSWTHYYPFGAVMSESQNGDYRFGFNGMESDPELKGEDNSYDFGARMYDPRIGRWLTIDPQSKKQPSQSPYKAFLNNPNLFIDPDGETEYHINMVINEKTGEATITVTVASSDVMTDGVKHTIWSGQSSYHQENYYYDFARVTVTTYKADGSIKVQKSTQIIKENGIKDKDYVLFGGDDKYDTHSEWYTAKDQGKEVSFGINMGGSTGGSGAIGQDWSKNAVGYISFDDLSAILSRSSISKGYSPESGSWQTLTKGQVQDFIEKAKESFETGEKIGEAAEETKKLYKENVVKSDSCTYCNGVGTKKEMEGHIDVVKRKGHEEKKK